MNAEIEKAICTVAWFTKGCGSAELCIQAIEAHIRALESAIAPLAALDLRPGGFDKADDGQVVCARDKSAITVGDVRRAKALVSDAP